MGKIIARCGELRLCAIEQGLCASILLFCLIVVALGGEAGLKKLLLTFEIGCHLAQFGFSRLNASGGAFNVSLLHFRVQARQHFP